MTLDAEQAKAQETSRVLVEALPYLQQLRGAIILVKLGGAALFEASAGDSMARDIALLKAVGLHPVIVHGGGKAIDATLKRLGIAEQWADGLRVTTPETLEVVEMVLSRINLQFVRRLRNAGASALGLHGTDSGLFKARRLKPSGSSDLGLVGDICEINTDVLHTYAHSSSIPVIAPLAPNADDDGHSVIGLNVNADSAAAALAAALPARRLLLMTDVSGVANPQGVIYTKLSPPQTESLLAGDEITGGMRPKLLSALHALEQGVEAVHILHGQLPHSMLLELLTDSGSGTMLRAITRGQP